MYLKKSCFNEAGGLNLQNTFLKICSKWLKKSNLQTSQNSFILWSIFKKYIEKYISGHWKSLHDKYSENAYKEYFYLFSLYNTLK